VYFNILAYEDFSFFLIWTLIFDGYFFYILEGRQWKKIPT